MTRKPLTILVLTIAILTFVYLTRRADAHASR